MIILTSLLDLFQVRLPDQSEAVQKVQENSSAYIRQALIIAPIAEELLFRSWLRSPTGIFYWLPGITLSLAALVALGSEAINETQATVVLSLLAIVTVLYITRYYAAKRTPGALELAARSIFPRVFWASAIFFALLHLLNYSLEGFNPVFVLLVVPQLIVGLTLGYVRMKYGLAHAILFHSAYNFLFFLLL